MKNAQNLKACKHIPVKGFEWNYLISEDGDVYSIKNKKYLTPNKNQDGYYRFTVYNDPSKRSHEGVIQKRLKIHNTVAIAFLGAKKGQTIHHKDGNKLNNKASNLEIIKHDEHSFLENRVLSDIDVSNIFSDYVDDLLTTNEICIKRNLTYNVVVDLLSSRSYHLCKIDINTRHKAKIILKMRQSRRSTQYIKNQLNSLQTNLFNAVTDSKNK